MAGSDITVEILREIRDEIRGTNARVDATNGRLDTSNGRLDTMEHVLSQRLGAVETALLDLASSSGSWSVTRRPSRSATRGSNRA